MASQDGMYTVLGREFKRTKFVKHLDGREEVLLNFPGDGRLLEIGTTMAAIVHTRRQKERKKNDKHLWQNTEKNIQIKKYSVFINVNEF